MSGRLRSFVGAVALGVAVSTLTGCVMTDEVGGSNNAPPTTVGLEPKVGAVGTAVEHGGVSLTVLDLHSFDQSPDGTPRIKVAVRTENLAAGARRNPDLRLLCDESELAGDWYSGSTWEPIYLLPVNALNEGEVLIGFPAKTDSPQYPVAQCSNATLIAEMPDTASDKDQVVTISVPASVIAEAIQRPRGPNLPLPDSID